MTSLSISIKLRIEQFKNDRLELLGQVKLSDVLEKHSLFSGEILVIGDFVYHRLDEYFSEKLFPLHKKLIDDLGEQIKLGDSNYDVITKIGYYTYDPNFEENWNQVYNLFVIEFVEFYVVHGKIDWLKLDMSDVLAE
jgi:hypothetical protein